MQSNYPSHMLEVSVAQICRTLGWEKANPSALHYLTHLLERYVRQIAYHTVRSAELNNRSAANLNDIAFVFAYLHIDMEQMEEYYRGVPAHPLPYDVPLVSIPNSGQPVMLPSCSLSSEKLKRKRAMLAVQEDEDKDAYGGRMLQHLKEP